MPITLPALLHVGIVVSDLDIAAADFQNYWGVATVRIMEPTFRNVRYLDQTITLTARYGFIATGASEIELIQPISAISPYADFLESNEGDGLHHLAYVVPAIDPYLAHLQARSPESEVVLDAPMPNGGRFVYVAGTAHGAVIELIERPA